MVHSYKDGQVSLVTRRFYKMCRCCNDSVWMLSLLCTCLYCYAC